MGQPVDSSILHEIVRIIESRRKVPAKVIVKSKEYLLTYLEDHERRLEDALARFDRDRLNMLYGQLASKIKYQLLRRTLPSPGAKTGPAGEQPARSGAAKPSPGKTGAASRKKTAAVKTPAPTDRKAERAKAKRSPARR